MSDNTDLNDDFRALKEQAREAREIKRMENTERAELLAEKYGLILKSYNEGTQLRFTKNGKAVDYYPTSGKINIRGQFRVENLERYLRVKFDIQP